MKEKTHPDRKDPRVAYELPVAYQTLSGFITDWATNISRGGLFIATPTPLPVGTRVKLLISLPETSFPYELVAKVVRVEEQGRGPDEPSGMGLSFVDIEPDKRSNIEQFVERLRQQQEAAEAPPGKTRHK